MSNLDKGIELPTGPWDLDLTNDGSLLACATGVRRAGLSPYITVFRTEDGGCVAQLRYSGFEGRGVAFVDGGRELVFLTRDLDGLVHRLHRVPVAELDDFVPHDREIRRYTPYEPHMWHVVRDPAARHFAVLGGQVEIWDAVAGEIRHTLPAANRDHPVRAAFSRDGRRLYAYGTAEGYVICYDVATAREVDRWPAPGDFGYQVLISPDERILLATGENHLGVFIYDLVEGRRLLTDADDIHTFDEKERYGPWVVTPDSGQLAVLHGRLRRFTLPELREVGHDQRSVPGLRAWQVASAWETPLAAFGVEKESRVLLFPVPVPVPVPTGE